MCSKPPVEACHFSVVHIVWCSEGPCEPSTEYQFTDLDPKPHEIENRGTDFTFYLYRGGFCRRRGRTTDATADGSAPDARSTYAVLAYASTYTCTTAW